MTEDEKKAAELTAEVFAETFMRMVKERLRLQISGNHFVDTDLGRGGKSTVSLNIALIDAKAPEGIPMEFCREFVTISLKKDNWGNHYLSWGP